MGISRLLTPKKYALRLDTVQNISIPPDQNLSIPFDENVLIFLVRNIYNENI